MNRADFFRMSAVAMAALTVPELTDRHDEWLFDREFERPDENAFPVSVTILDEHGSVLIEQTVLYVPDGAQLRLRAETILRYDASEPVAVTRGFCSYRWAPFGKEIDCTMPLHFTGVQMLPGDTLELRLSDITWSAA